MLTHIPWPFRYQLLEAFHVSREERSRRLFKAGTVSGHIEHKAVCRFLRLAFPVSGFATAKCVFDQFAQRNRGTAGLTCKPLPMPWHQRYFAWYDSQPG